ncbi:universal stress protein [Variovorax sp. Root434]|uniref:universal stress protein n=1 Tax=Variovorax sp. Root434 TaxID=1736536 RepID=UPI0006F392B8|nr:universal stress protein [Variovorax sp. Root434]KQX21456.1 hypothetical protein ASD05_18045 [Variovorax sp. Root434]
MDQRILVPVDGSPTSQRGLAEAIRLAKLRQGRLRVFHAIDDRLLEEAKASATMAGVEAETVLCDRLSGPVYELVSDALAFE